MIFSSNRYSIVCVYVCVMGVYCSMYFKPYEDLTRIEKSDDFGGHLDGSFKKKFSF